MNRRLFLKWIPAIAGISIFNPTKIIYDLCTTPIIGENYSRLTESQIIANELAKIHRKLPELFERDTIFYQALEKRSIEIVSSRDMRIPLQLKPGGRFR